MQSPSYIFRRPESDCYFFRWVVPVELRHILAGRKEIRRSLRTDDKRFALRLARRLAVTLERGKLMLMANHGKENTPPSFYLTLKLFERMADGAIRMEGLEMDPDKGEEERKHLDALLGAGKPPSVPSISSLGGGKSLSDLIAAYQEEKQRGGTWTDKTRREYGDTYSLVSELIGSGKALNGLTAGDLNHFKDLIKKLPSNRSKDSRYRDKSALELAGMTIPKSDLLSVTTINKILTRTGTLLQWGVVHGFVAANYAQGMAIAKSKRDDEERPIYTEAEIGRLKKAILTGESGAEGSPYMKWVPMIGMYSGMRLNEICQLDLSDLREVDGIPVINVNDDGEYKRVKNANARRDVPVHPELIALGLMDFVSESKKGRATRLFPELSHGRDGYGQTVSRWFGRYRKSIGLTRDFHSLRHTVITKLREEGVPKDLIADLVGHSRDPGETFGRYAKAAAVARKLDALKKLEYSVK